MRKLQLYINEFLIFPNQIILKRFKRGIYYQGKLSGIPDQYLQYYVLDHSRLDSRNNVEFTIVEDLNL